MNYNPYPYFPPYPQPMHNADDGWITHKRVNKAVRKAIRELKREEDKKKQNGHGHGEKKEEAKGFLSKMSKAEITLYLVMFSPFIATAVESLYSVATSNHIKILLNLAH